MTDSFYDQFSANETPVYEHSDKPFSTPHENRKDMAKPYSSPIQQKCDNAPTDSKPLTSVYYEWALFIANRSSHNPTAQKVNLSFERNSITGDNFQSEKERYFNLYNKTIGE